MDAQYPAHRKTSPDGGVTWNLAYTRDCTNSGTCATAHCSCLMLADGAIYDTSCTSAAQCVPTT